MGKAQFLFRSGRESPTQRRHKPILLQTVMFLDGYLSSPPLFVISATKPFVPSAMD